MWIKLDVPPGLYRLGTEYQSMGRFYESNLVRWFQGMKMSIGGWAQLGASTVSGSARAIHTWVDNNLVSRVAIGTERGVWTCSAEGTLVNITPTGWSNTDASLSAWSIDNGGSTLLAVNDETGVIYQYRSGTDTELVALSSAPTAEGLFVTNERILVAIGASGDPRLMAWSDSEDFTDWSSTPVNLAGDLFVQTPGTLLAGMKVRGGSLIWSTEDLHMMRFLGLPSGYGIERVASNCGAVSRSSMVVIDSMALWMGGNQFFVYNGYVEALPCTVFDDVFRDMNRSHAHKVRAVHIAEFNEVWWCYPKGAATENSHVVAYNYKENHWSLHSIARFCGVARGNGFEHPLMIDGDGAIWQHENGTSKAGAGVCYARTGPLELGDGQRVMHARRVVPDEGSAGDVEVRFRTRFFPNGTETHHGPFSAANPMDVRFTGRQVSMEFREVQANDWRVGTYRFEIAAGGLR